MDSALTTYISKTKNDLTKSECRDAFSRELESWKENDAFIRVPYSSIPRDANIIGSHTIFKRKDDRSVKARIVPWGHRDNEREDLRSDSPCVNLDIFRLVLSFAAEFKWTIAQMDVKTAFLQALGFDRKVFVKPPKEANDLSGLWELRAPAYGLVDSGRLWYRTSDSALITEYNLTKSRYEHTLYYKKNDTHTTTFILVAQVDNYIYAGTETEIYSFETFLQERFKIGTIEKGLLNVMGTEISQAKDGTISLTQSTKIQSIDEEILNIDVPGAPRQANQIASPAQISAFRTTLGKMLYIGRMSSPIMLYHASFMASKTNRLETHHLKNLKSFVKLDKRTPPSITFNSTDSPGNFSLEVISDASMSSKAEEGGRGAYIIYRRCNDVVHPLFWSARKLRRVSRSSSTAELLAASDAASNLVYLQELIAEVSYRPLAEMLMDSRALVNLTTSIKEPAEQANKLDLAAIRERFTLESIHGIGWVPGHYNIADALTKDNRETAALLSKVLREGTYPLHPDTFLHYAEPSITTKIDMGDDEMTI